MRLLTESESVLKALRLATAAHSGQVDKAGEDYIKHPITVAESVSTEEAQTAALLHDVVEDTGLTLDDLRQAGFSEGILCAVDALTHREGESREAYITRLAKKPLAVTVKLADLRHNSDLSRLTSPTETDYMRVARYKGEIELLQRAHI